MDAQRSQALRLLKDLAPKLESSLVGRGWQAPIPETDKEIAGRRKVVEELKRQLKSVDMPEARRLEMLGG